MSIHSKSEKGQAIILIAVSMFVAIAFIALAIDGGNAFADRRHAQNAADSAALATAMRYAQDQTLSDSTLNALALERASANGYNNTMPRSIVAMKKLPISSGDCITNKGYYFQVDIDSFVPTWFAKIVGVSQMHNHVLSKSLGCPPMLEIPFAGNAIVALDPVACRALEIAGSSITNVTSTSGQGLFVNSSCSDASTNPQNALYGGSGSVTTPSVNVVGGIYHPENFGSSTINTGVAPFDRDQYGYPTAEQFCNSATTATVTGATMHPGLFPGSNSSWASKTFPPAGVTSLEPGIYCLDNSFKTVNSNILSGTGVTFIIRNGNVDIQGGSLHLYAPPQTSSDALQEGILFYLPKSNTGGSVQINGNSESIYTGSITAPWQPITLNGSGDTSTPAQFNSQIIGNTVTIGGNGALNIHYDPGDNQQLPKQGSIELSQ